MRAAVEAAWPARFPNRSLSKDTADWIAEALLEMRKARLALLEAEPGADRARLVQAVAEARAEAERILEAPLDELTAEDEGGLTPEDDDRPVWLEPLPPPPSPLDPD